jgi:phage terminase small subunit
MAARIRGLTEKQKRFCDYYIETGNASEAARKAGYKGNNLNKVASENLAKLDIKEYIDERMKELQSKRIADQEEILSYLTSILRGEQKEETLIGLGMGEQGIDKIEVSAKDRIKAAELLGKRYSLWTDRTEITGEIVTIVDDLTDDDLDG